MSEADNGFKVSRRSLFGAGGGLLLGAATATAGNEDPATRPVSEAAKGLSRQLATFVSDTPFDALPVASVTMTKRSIMDAIGVSMAAAGLEDACKPFLELAFSDAADDAVVIGTGRKSGMIMAALGNGALAHALDYEDAHGASFTHPNAATVAAALAVADARGAVTGKAFITAVAVGCDLVCRLSIARGNLGKPPRAFYPPAIVGTFGATAAAARLMQLDANEVLDALSLVLCSNSHSAQILYSPYSDIRAVRDGLCAQAGVQAALLASRGVKGFDSPIEGKGGFFSMYSDARFVPGALTDGLGTSFAGEEVGFKAWPACRASHIYIQAILEGLEKDGLDPAEVESVHANVKESDLIICEPAAEKRRPRAAIDAKFSLYFVVATALLNRQVVLGSFNGDAMRESAVLALADRVTYEIDEAEARPRAEGGGTLLTVRLSDGSERRWGIDTLYGSPANPMSENALVRKFVDCGRAAPTGPGDAELEQVARTLLALESVSDMRTITKNL